MRKQLLLTLTACLFGLVGMSTTFYSINNGNWNNTTNVWSLNGSTPCNCAPSFNLSIDTVVVRHTVVPNGNLTISNHGVIKVLSSGSLINLNTNVNVSNGLFYANGPIQIGMLTIGNLGKVDLFSCPFTIQSSLNVSGIFTSNFSNITINQGNAEVKHSGSISLCTNSKLEFGSGNLKNEGSISICEGSCIHLSVGNIQNEDSGIFTGNGSLITEFGNIKNYASWDLLLKWCSAGNTFGLSSPENCVTATANCNAAPLPTELISFSLVSEGRSNILNWYAISEKNADYYIIERSKDGFLWEELTQMKTSNNEGEAMHYMYVDNQPIFGISYYRLSLISFDGKTLFTAILGIDTESLDDVLIYPNPTSDFVTVKFSRTLPTVTLRVLNASGQLLETFQFEEFTQETILLPMPCGLYYISIESETVNETLKVMKR